MTVPSTRPRPAWPWTPVPGLVDRRDRPNPNIALVGTYPPTACGIASFGAALRTAMAIDGADGQGPDVVRVVEPHERERAAPEVVAALRPDDPRSVKEAARILSGYDATILQHEFGLYGPRSGIAVLDLADALTAPLIVTLHTVAEFPTDEQWHIITRLTARATRTVVLSEVAKSLLVDWYGINPDTVEVIPHGSEIVDRSVSAPLTVPIRRSTGPVLLTWGLIGPGKGLEWSLMATEQLRRSYPDIHYVIAGETHPKVAARDGQAYRHALEDMSRRLGIASNVTMIDRYLPRPAIHDLIRQATAVVLPYESLEQTSSGVLVEAVAAGIPIVASAFPHAREIERMGGAVTVPHRDPAALAAAIEGLLHDPVACSEMVAAQRDLAGRLSWRNVGARYAELVHEVKWARA